MKQYTVTAWQTVGGHVTVEADSLEEAHKKVNDLIENDEFINHETFSTNHREHEILED